MQKKEHQALAVQTQPNRPRLMPSLRSSLATTSLIEVAEGKTATNDKLALLNTQKALTMQTAATAPKVFQLTSKAHPDYIGSDSLLKTLCMVIQHHNSTVKAKPEMKMSAIEIIEAAQMLAEKYTHEAPEDFIMAFKLSKKEGRKNYQAFGIDDVMEIMNGYFERKADMLQELNRQKKTLTDNAAWNLEEASEERREEITEKIKAFQQALKERRFSIEPKKGIKLKSRATLNMEIEAERAIRKAYEQQKKHADVEE